jgi:hypothetical protein
MAWTNPLTWTVNQIVTAAQLNTHVRDNLLFLYNATVTGIIPATGTTATAGTGFTYTHTNGTGVYVFTYSVAYSATPVVSATIADASASQEGIQITAQSATGFTIRTDNAGAATDHAFDFLAYAVK